MLFLSDDLTIDYQFTFNLSKAEDKHLRGINFRNIPTKRDVDVDFSITCSVPAKVLPCIYVLWIFMHSTFFFKLFLRFTMVFKRNIRLKIKGAEMKTLVVDGILSLHEKAVTYKCIHSSLQIFMANCLKV